MLVARHEPEIGGTTNVADHPEFASRKTTKVIDGATSPAGSPRTSRSRSSRRCAPRSASRTSARHNTRYDGKFEIPTFQEVLDLRAQLSRKLHRQIGVYPETKHPSYFRSIGLPLEPELVSTLNRNGLNRHGAPVFVQSFEIGNLQALDHVLKVPLVQLLDEPRRCIPRATRASPRYGEMATPAGLRKIATYADGVGPWKNYIIPRTADDCIGQADELRQGRPPGRPRRPPVHVPARELVHAAASCDSSADPAGIGDLVSEIRQFIRPRRRRLLHRQRGLRRRRRG